MAGFLQPLDQKFLVVNPDGTPTDYFTRWAQQRMDDIVAAATADQVSAAIDTWAAARLINTASPLEGGGSLAADLNLSHAASGVTAGTYGDATHVAQITVDTKGHVTAVVDVVITGGGGGGTAWSSITGTPTTLAGYGITDAAPLSHVGSGGAAHALVVAAGAAGFMSGADKTKLNGIAAGATANATDAFLLARSNHTGTQSAATITGLSYFATGANAANLTGTLAVAQMPSTTGGDVSNTAGGFTLTIGANKVTRAMLAQTAGATILGATAAGNVADLTNAQAKTFLAIVAADVGGLGYFATGTDAANLTGTVPAGQLPQFTGGDVTTGGVGSVNLTIGANKVTRGMLAATAGATLLGSTGAGNVADLTAAQAKTFLAIVAADVSGLGYFSTGTNAANLTGTMPASILPDNAVGGVDMHLNISGLYIDTYPIANASTASTVVNRMMLYPWVPSRDTTITQIGVECTAGAAGANTKVVVYDSDATTGAPNNLLKETGNLDCSGTGFKGEAWSTTFSKGTRYWLGVRCSTSTATLRVASGASMAAIGRAASTGGSGNQIQTSLTYATAANNPFGAISAATILGGNPWAVVLLLT